MPYIPIEQGICHLILRALEELLTMKLREEIDDQDLSRATTIKVGMREENPTPVVVLLHENDPNNPEQWPHFPLRMAAMGESGGTLYQRRLFSTTPSPISELRSSTGTELVGGGSRMARTFTIEIEVWGERFKSYRPQRAEVGQIASVVENRIIAALREAGPRINGTTIVDNFGETVGLGPFFGECWTERGESESLIIRKYLRIYYVTIQLWNTTGW